MGRKIIPNTVFSMPQTADRSVSRTTSGGGIPGGNRRPKAGLLGVRWRRIILDEAHSIRNTNTDQVWLEEVDGRGRVG